jgi:hypothetical protein
MVESKAAVETRLHAHGDPAVGLAMALRGIRHQCGDRLQVNGGFAGRRFGVAEVHAAGYRSGREGFISGGGFAGAGLLAQAGERA